MRAHTLPGYMSIPKTEENHSKIRHWAENCNLSETLNDNEWSPKLPRLFGFAMQEPIVSALHSRVYEQPYILPTHDNPVEQSMFLHDVLSLKIQVKIYLQMWNSRTIRQTSRIIEIRKKRTKIMSFYSIRWNVLPGDHRWIELWIPLSCIITP